MQHAGRAAEQARGVFIAIKPVAGRFDAEIAPVTIEGRKGPTVVDTDEHPRRGSTLDGL
ncbi:MAG: hypothetical protein ACK40A_13550, partial [Pannonibacter indicus]